MPDKVECRRCGKSVKVRKNGTLWQHYPLGEFQEGEPCAMSGGPVRSVAEGFGECGTCGQSVKLDAAGEPVEHFEGADERRGVCGKPQRVCVATLATDDECGMVVRTPGAYRCDLHLCADRSCEDCWWSENDLYDNPTWPRPTHLVSEPAATVPSMDDTKKTEADAFLDPTPSASAPDTAQEPARDQWGRYLLPHPVDGTYSDGKTSAGRRNGWMRATTFAKAAADTFALTRYNERLTLVGATLRPDVVALAHGKDVRQHRTELDRWVDEVKNAAGAKVAANLGTAVHSFTERVDAGELTLADVPELYREHVEHYLTALRVNGLECVPGLIERTTFTSEFNVAGTFDRIYRLPDGTYAIGDLKTGRDLKYGQMEIAVQLALYAHGVNSAGVYDWGAGQWLPARSYGDSIETGPWEVPEVRTDIGVVVHLPVQGDLAGTCTIKTVDLNEGWKAAQVAADVLRARKGAYMRDGLHLPVAEPTERRGTYWLDLFALVKTRDEANALYKRAKSEGVSDSALAALVVVGKGALENAARGL